jgi:pyrroline-5-carboxylate reductase
MMAVGPVWLIGCGNMGGAMLRGWIANGLDPAQVIVVDPALPLVPDGVAVSAEIPRDSAAPFMVLLAIKPQLLDQVAPDLAAAVSADTLLVSILAGVETAALASRIPAPERILRVMPNLPAAIGLGMNVLFARGAVDRAAATALFSSLGQVEWIEDEQLFHAVTALSGSGPAFVFRFAAAMARAGAALGLAEDQAVRLALGTLEGSAAYAWQAGEPLDALANRVASPNGTTRAGLDIMDGDARLVDVVRETIIAAAQRSEELARDAGG